MSLLSNPAIFAIMSLIVVRGFRSIWGFVVPATAVALLALGGEGAIGSAALPDPDELPKTMVAVVSEVPVRRGRITKAEFQHALLLAAVAAGRRSAPRPGGAEYEKLKTLTLKNLLEGAWIVGLAVEWGISVTHRQVSREVARVKQEAFKSDAEFRKFLKEARYTRRDINERVEIQMLSSRLQGRISKLIRSKTSNRREEQRAFQKFLDEFVERWTARTVCAPDYAISRCSNGPAA